MILFYLNFSYIDINILRFSLIGDVIFFAPRELLIIPSHLASENYFS